MASASDDADSLSGSLFAGGLAPIPFELGPRDMGFDPGATDTTCIHPSLSLPAGKPSPGPSVPAVSETRLRGGAGAANLHLAVNRTGPPMPTPALTGTSPTSPLLPGSGFAFAPDLSNWGFQDTPPYESFNPQTPFDPAPAPTWPFASTLPDGLPDGDQLGLHPHPLSPPLPARLSSPPSPRQQRQQRHPSAPGSSSGTLGKLRLSPQARGILTQAQQEKLRSIAMPAHLQYREPNANPESPVSSASGHDKADEDSPEPADRSSKAGSRKRKSSADVDDDDDDDDLDGQPVKKTAHNMIEKRYRTNLNDKIAALRDSVPALRIMSKSARGEDTTEDREELHGLTPAHKLNKATVLSKATEYIRHLEKRNNRLLEENANMQVRIAAFEKLFTTGAVTGQLPNHLQPGASPMPATEPAGFMATPGGTPQPSDPPGLIPIPDDIKRILIAQQMSASRPYMVPPQGFPQNPAAVRQHIIQQQQQQQQQQQVQDGRWNPYIGKLTVGSLAGLLIVEALSEDEKNTDAPEGRGLSAGPLQLVASYLRSATVHVGGYSWSVMEIIAKIRLVALLGILVWLVIGHVPWRPRPPKSEKQTHDAVAVKAVPSLASPIHVRRQAWLTSIQTVWVPRHEFLLEASALMLKTLKYTLRHVIGDRGYLMLTGLTEEQEVARVKAWTIALDAQLAGGDVEINKSRLTLTLLASGTLPDTPLRLMMRALHIRLLLWELQGASWAANAFGAKLARRKWNEARELYRITSSLHKDAPPPDEDLPDHLSLLLEQDCDEVLNDAVIQRAHNLAWNHPATHKALDRVDGMDAVVEDPAVRSPMDAVAAWYSSLLLHGALSQSLTVTSPEERKEEKDDDHDHDFLARHAGLGSLADIVSLAVDMAPIGSNAQVRGLVARAVLVSERRGANIAAAMQAMGPSQNPDRHPEYSRGVPALIDSPMTAIDADPAAQTALRCAMAIAHLQRFASPSRDSFAMVDSVVSSLCLFSDGSSNGEGPGSPGTNSSMDARQDCALPAWPAMMSLLGFVASFHLMAALHGHEAGRRTCGESLERLAASLRIWIGSKACARSTGLDGEATRAAVERCLRVTRSLVGIEKKKEEEVSPGPGPGPPGRDATSTPSSIRPRSPK